MDEMDRESARLDFLMAQKLRRQKALLEEENDIEDDEE
jgi:hypothetical protein